MQLDRTRIAIRERGWLERLDLALHVLRQFAGPLTVTGLIGAVPLAVGNYWLLETMLGRSFHVETYAFFLTVLVVFEIPWATSLSTLYLGRAMFYEDPRPGELARTWFGSWPQLILYQVLLRGLTLGLVVTFFLPYSNWPYLNEVILLERNPLTRGRQPGLTTRQRSVQLHSATGSDFLAQALASAVLGAALVLSLWLSFWFAGSILLSDWGFPRSMYLVWLPVALWVVAQYFTVVRFLNYLDLRIRREGWELDLLLRAEGARVARRIA